MITLKCIDEISSWTIGKRFNRSNLCAKTFP
jgi:hypothetical protein